MIMEFKQKEKKVTKTFSLMPSQIEWLEEKALANTDGNISELLSQIIDTLKEQDKEKEKTHE